jgi:PucR family transcriptional regulator, purine catabolism regulatory protein
MRSPDSPLTLENLLAAICPSAQIIAGKERSSQAVHWVVTLVPGWSIDRAILPGDFAMILPPYSNELARILAGLAERRAVGAALLGSVATNFIGSDSANLAVAMMPEDADLAKMEIGAMEALGHARLDQRTRAAEIYARLTQMFVEGFGLDAVALELADLTHKIVLIQDKRLRTIATAIPPGLGSDWDQIRNDLGNLSILPENLRDRKRAAEQPHAVQQELDAFLARLAAPIVAKGMARGFISLIGPTKEFHSFDARLTERGAAACALEMAKAKALREVEQRVRGDFVDAIIAGNLTRAEASRWAERISFPETGAYAALSFAWSSAGHPSWRRLETIISGELRAKTIRAHARAREDEIVVFVALDPSRGIEAARKLAERVDKQTFGEFPQARLATGIGRIQTDLLTLRESHTQASQARTMGARLAEQHPLYFGDLSVYRLLFQLEHSPELESFCNEILGTLIEYDRTQKSNLVETLLAYFAHHENLTQTARTMHLHRNSLLYRIARIQEITHWDLSNSETRLAVQLALRAFRMLSPHN